MLLSYRSIGCGVIGDTAHPGPVVKARLLFIILVCDNSSDGAEMAGGVETDRPAAENFPRKFQLAFVASSWSSRAFEDRPRGVVATCGILVLNQLSMSTGYDPSRCSSSSSIRHLVGAAPIVLPDFVAYA